MPCMSDERLATPGQTSQRLDLRAKSGESNVLAPSKAIESSCPALANTKC